MIAGKVTIDVTGLLKVDQVARQRSITLKGVKAGARILNAAAKAGAPRASGALRKAQGIKAAKGRKGKTISYAVQGSRLGLAFSVTRPGRRKATKAVPAFYDHLVRLGTKPHAVGKGSKLARKGKSSGVVQAGGMHPGTQPNPFRERAWASVKDRAAAATLAVMGTEVQKAIAAAGVK